MLRLLLSLNVLRRDQSLAGLQFDSMWSQSPQLAFAVCNFSFRSQSTYSLAHILCEGWLPHDGLLVMLAVSLDYCFCSYMCHFWNTRHSCVGEGGGDTHLLGHLDPPLTSAILSHLVSADLTVLSYEWLHHFAEYVLHHSVTFYCGSRFYYRTVEVPQQKLYRFREYRTLSRRIVEILCLSVHPSICIFYLEAARHIWMSNGAGSNFALPAFYDAANARSLCMAYYPNTSSLIRNIPNKISAVESFKPRRKHESALNVCYE